jgi:hypothetical protein
MLERVDRVQLAVAESGPATRQFQDILGAEMVREDESDYLDARRTILALGASEVELCAPRGAGVVRAHLDRWGPGLLTAGFSVASVPALRAHLSAEGVEFTKDGDQTYLEPGETLGMRVVISPAGTRKTTGLVRHLYEVTNTIVSDWTAAAQRYTRLFGLDPARFSPSHSDRFGYTGTLTLFDPPARLARHHARFTPRGGDPTAERDGLWIHPSALSGLLLGISRTTVGWEWSGRPELVTH